MNIEIIRKLLNSGNIDDAKIGLIMLKGKSAQELYKIFPAGASHGIHYTISTVKFPHLDFEGIYYKLTDNVSANIYCGGIIVADKKTQYEEL